ncbi:MAG: DNA repair protein RecN [Alphaproteobacteria bacterium]|nr:MAG: DNA repair protein RecN [Alphaproteobacteria bacterium]
MLMSLSIKNVVLIDQLVIEFKHGLCALTGETGAGKSILLDSLGLALGVRAESGLVRNGTESASVTASFQISEDHEAYRILEEADISVDDDMLLMRRVVYNSGKSRAFINDQPVSVGLLKRVGDSLVEIHGQFETQGLLNPQTHRSMLDEYAQIKGSLAAFWDDWKNQEQALDDLYKMSERAHREEEYLRISLEDLDKLSPEQGEEEGLAKLRERLRHRESVLEGLNAAGAILGNEYDPVQHAWAELDKIAEKCGDDIEGAISALSRASSEIAEADAVIQRISEDLQDRDDNLEEIDDRLYALRMQARKHQCSVDELPELREEISKQLNMIEHADDVLREQKDKCAKARRAYVESAEKLSKKRHSVAAKLNKLVQKELIPLKLEKARFVTHIEPLDEVEWNVHGMDRVRFLVSTNPGREPGPIHKIASGGEMSRFMLALKVVIAQVGSTHSFIFDEVDTGIGGATADAVGERLARLADSKQVLVVTHAPQVAARADNHWIVKKSGKGEVTTDIIPLTSRKDRCEEIARMLAGADITAEARAAANKLLDNAA